MEVAKALVTGERGKVNEYWKKASLDNRVKTLAFIIKCLEKVENKEQVMRTIADR